MRQHVLRGSAGTMVVGALTLMAVVALGKGQVDSQLSEAEDAGQLQTAFEDAMRVCSPANVPEDCFSEDFPTADWCSRREVSRIRTGGSSVCDAICDADLANVTVADCQDEGWLNTLCGVREKLRMEIPDDLPCTPPVTSCPPHPSLCVRLIRAKEEAAQQNSGSVMPGLQPREVVIPENTVTAEGHDDGYNGGGDGTLIKATIPVNDESAKGIYSGGTGRHYWSHGTSETVAFRDVAATLARQMIAQRHARWDNNGVALGDASFMNYGEGCREYIYEKYYDYTAFENRARELGDSERTRFDVAFDSSGSAPEYQPWAIGRRGLGGIPLRRKDLEPNGAQVEFNAEKLQQKNTLFETPVHDILAGRNLRLAEWQAYQDTDNDGSREYLLTFNDASLLVDLPRPFAGGLVYIKDDDIDQTLRTGRTSESPMYRYQENWQWHLATGTTLSANYLDEELYAAERFKERLAFLLLQRSNMFRAYKKALEPLLTFGGAPIELVEAAGGFDPDEQAGDPFSQYFVDQHDARAATAAASGIELSSGAGFQASAGDFAAEQAAAGQQAMAGIIENFGLAGLLGAMGRQLATSSTSSIDPSDIPVHMTSPTHELLKNVRDAMLDLVAQDEKIEAVLVAARRRGCLNLDEPNPCDWSPRTFAQRVEDPFMGAREIEYQRCLDYTSATGFSAVANADADRFRVVVNSQNFYSEVDEQPCLGGAYNQDTDRVERYMACNDRYRQDIIKALNAELENGGVVVDPESGDLSISEESTDADTLGNDVFGISYSYGATWSVTGLPSPPSSPDQTPPYCDLKPHLSGHFWADAHVLVADISLVDASGEVGLDPDKPDPQAHLTVLDQELININPVGGDPNPRVFNVVAEETKQDRGDIFSIGATFVIVVVPVSLKGGLAGVVGATAQLAAGSNGGGATACEQGGMVLRATFEPFVGVEAFASVSIDAVIVEAGVKISVTIAQVSFPFTTDLKFTGKRQGEALDVILDGTSNLSVVFSFLGGRFSAFVEFCLFVCEEFEETLFEWSGLVFKTTLFETHFEVPLFPLMEYQQQRNG